MDAASLEFNLGSVSWHFGRLNFFFIVLNNGNAYLQLFADDPSNARKSGVLLQVAEYGYRTLKQLLVKAEETIEKLKISGQLNRLALMYSTDISVRVKLGMVESLSGYLSFSVVVQQDGGGYLQLYASRTSGRGGDILLCCDDERLETLKGLVQKTDDLIGRLRDSGQMKEQLVIAS